MGILELVAIILEPIHDRPEPIVVTPAKGFFPKHRSNRIVARDDDIQFRRWVPAGPWSPELQREKRQPIDMMLELAAAFVAGPGRSYRIPA